jgi:integrase
MVRAEIAKTGRPRLLPLSDIASSQLILYQDMTHEKFSTPTSKVFGPIPLPGKSPVLLEKRQRFYGLTSSAVVQTFRRISEHSGIEIYTSGGQTRYLTFHELRHTASTDFGTKTIDLTQRQVDYMMGHETPGTAGIYDHTKTRDRDEIVAEIRKKLEAADAVLRATAPEYFAHHRSLTDLGVDPENFPSSPLWWASE